MNHDRPFQREFDKTAEKLPALLWEGLVKDKLKAQGIKIRKKALRKIVAKILDGDFDTIEFDDADIKVPEGTEPDLTLSLDEKDLEELETRSERFMKRIPKMTKRLAKQASKDFVRAAYTQWLEDYALRQSELAAFSERLRYRWRKGLIPLNGLLEMSREYGQQRIDEEISAAEGALKPRLDVLFGLHLRGCQVCSEIITLLEAGYADGAMARWRTLFELTVVAALIKEADDETAQKYLDHNHVDALKAANRYMQTSPFAISEPVPEAEMAALNARVDELVERYGPSYKQEYGWAAELTGNPNPNFATLVKQAEKETSQSIYKMASFNIHAGARSLFFRQTAMLSHSGLIAGASNSGLEDPGAQTANSISQLTALILPDPVVAIDDIIILNVIIRLRKAADKGFYRAAEKLHKEDVEQVALREHGIPGAGLIDIADYRIVKTGSNADLTSND
tara:strand:+ start:4432 stop:5787 length:1356 start_codon:yes stop_codon:yes gene_type:complete